MVLLRSTKINGPMIGLDYVFHLVVDHIYDEVFSEDLQTQLIKSIFPQSFFFFFFENVRRCPKYMDLGNIFKNF